jgi:hypothetical protein
LKALHVLQHRANVFRRNVVTDANPGFPGDDRVYQAAAVELAGQL